MIDLLTTIVPALLPPVADGVRGVFNRFTGGAGAEPANVEERIQLMNATVKQVEALAELDKPAGNVSQWVANIRALQRPFATATVLLGYMVAILVAAPPEITAELGSFAQMATFYLFGDRSYSYFRERR